MKPSSKALFAMLLTAGLLAGCAATGSTPASSSAEVPAAATTASTAAPATAAPAAKSTAEEPECD